MDPTHNTHSKKPDRDWCSSGCGGNLRPPPPSWQPSIDRLWRLSHLNNGLSRPSQNWETKKEFLPTGHPDSQYTHITVKPLSPLNFKHCSFLYLITLIHFITMSLWHWHFNPTAILPPQTALFTFSAAERTVLPISMHVVLCISVQVTNKNL